jgi:hypothetical protein
MRSVPLVSLCAALLVAALAGPAVAAPPPSIPGVAKPTPIAVWQGRQVWSVPNATGGYGLVQRIGSGPVSALPVAPRGVPFDVDLGPTSSGPRADEQRRRPRGLLALRDGAAVG